MFVLKCSHSLFLILLFAINVSQTSQFQTQSECNTSQYYNILTHTCLVCPLNTEVSPEDKTFCNCTSGYYKNNLAVGFMWSESCISLAGTGEIATLYSSNGSISSSLSWINCSGNAFPNSDKTKCIPCGEGMEYDTSLKMCICASGSYPVGWHCLPLNGTNPVTSQIDQQLYGIGSLGCNVSTSAEACEIILNKCAERGYIASDQFCTLLTNKGINYQYSNTNLEESIGIYASSVEGTDSGDVKNQLDFMLFEYDIFGRLEDIKVMDTTILPCFATEEDVIHFQSFGLNLLKTCEESDLQSLPDTFFDIYVITSTSQYSEILSTSTSTTFYKRYYPKSIRSLKMSYKSSPPLTVPYLTTSTTESLEISTVSTSDSINLVLMAPFIVFNVGIAVIFILNLYKYMKYNPDENNDPYYCFKALFLFFLMAVKHWGIGLWIWLLGSSAYCFCFYKFQQTVFLLLPDMFTQWAGYYDPFMILFYIQFGFVLFSVILFIYDIGTTTDYFMVDWEKEKSESDYGLSRAPRRPVSVWRKVLVVNELYELTVAQLTNTHLTILFGILFLDGLKWINLSYQIPNVNNLFIESTSTRNIVLAYFIITFIFFIIFVIQYVLRFLVKTWNPLPYEDFVDLCCISNISLIIFDQSLHGFYIHGMNPLGKAEGSLDYIESVFEKEGKSYGKSRAFRSDDPEQTQTFEMILPFEIRQVFQMKYKSKYLQALFGKAIDTSILARPIPEMLGEEDYKAIENIQNDMLESFKYYLEGVKTSEFNVRERTFFEKLISCPVDVDHIGKLPIFFKDYWNEFTEVLFCGHEFTLVINLINFINIFYIATGSVVIACLIAMIVCNLVIKNIANMMARRNISRNTLLDDRFFN